jgi:hypothetical protein
VGRADEAKRASADGVPSVPFCRKEKWALPNKAPGYWRSPAVTCMPPNELAERKLANKMAPSIHGVY